MACLDSAFNRRASIISRTWQHRAIPSHFSYQSECRDQRPHDRHWVSVHWWRQAGQTPPVSKVFHSCPQVQDHRSALRGDQPQSGHRMRGPEGSRLLSAQVRDPQIHNGGLGGSIAECGHSQSLSRGSHVRVFRFGYKSASCCPGNIPASLRSGFNA